MDIHNLNFVEASKKVMDGSYTTRACALLRICFFSESDVCKKGGVGVWAHNAMMVRSLQVTVLMQHVLPLTCLIAVSIALHVFLHLSNRLKSLHKSTVRIAAVIRMRRLSYGMLFCKIEDKNV
jgi:hypothetical protein